MWHDDIPSCRDGSLNTDFENVSAMMNLITPGELRLPLKRNSSAMSSVFASAALRSLESH